MPIQKKPAAQILPKLEILSIVSVANAAPLLIVTSVAKIHRDAALASSISLFRESN